VVFAEPWQAQALALATALERAGCFTAAEWSEALGAAIRRSDAEGRSGDGSADDGLAYHLHVLAALETLVTAKGAVTRSALATRKAAWRAAYLGTPHGDPVRLATGTG
jgi:nitrile hydratase accessory protein